MRYNKLGSSELQVSELCLGTMTWGEQNSEAEGHQQLDYALSRGINFVDAAEMYPVPPRAETQGRTEAIVGSWLKKNGKRDHVIVATKIASPGRGFAWVRGGPRINRAQIQQAVDSSLRRLQTDYIDLFQIHWPERYVPGFGKIMYDPSQERPLEPIEEQLAAFAEVIQAGKVRYLGVSNETPWGLCEWIKQAQLRSLPKIVSVQNAYNLINRVYEMGLSEITRREDVPLLAYSPLGFGHLTGKYLHGAKPDGARLTRFPAFGQRYAKVNVEAAVARYAELAASLDLAPATMALAFVRSKWFVAATIIGATNLDQLKQNIDSAAVTLEPQASAAIDAIHEDLPNPTV